MAGFYSYENLLIQYLKDTKPERILEYGPGRSTKFMLDNSEAEIYSIEHDAIWCANIEELVKNEPRIHLYHITEENEYCEKRFPFKFDLIFVDGLCAWRVHCLKSAIDMLADNGHVILHDSERSIYNEGRDLYDTVIEYDGTALLIPKNETNNS